MGTIIDKLDQLVTLKCDPFCYSCYIKAKATDDGYKCPKCGTDDLMNLLEGYGCEWGTESFYAPVLESIDAAQCEASCDEDWYEDHLNEAYGTVTICGVEFDSGNVFRKLDPTAFELGLSDLLDSRTEDGEIIEINGTYYRCDELEQLIDDAIDEAEINC